MKQKIAIILLAFLIYSCSKSSSKLDEKGFPVSNPRSNESEETIDGIQNDSFQFETRPRNVLLTGNTAHRLTPIYKLNYNKKREEYYTGSNSYHYGYYEWSSHKGNQWNNNFMPGFEAVYGYNFVNVSHYNNETQTEHKFFEQPVLIKTLYYPTYSKDTLNGEPVLRKHYMISAYDEDTNEDGFITIKDLRRFYYFDINATQQRPLVPKNYSVMNSEYDPANDFMYIFAKLDQNENGQMDVKEDIHIFWIDLKNPERTGREY